MLRPALDDWKRLSCAMRRDDEEGARQAIARMRVNVVENRTEVGTPLVWAVRKGHTELVRTLLFAHRADPNDVGFFGMAPLLSAASLGHEPILRALLEAGADLAHTDAWGGSALTVTYSTPCILTLIEAGVDVDQRCAGRGESLLFRADEACTRALLDAGARVDLVSSSGETPLMRALWYRDLGRSRLLLDAGADALLVVSSADGARTARDFADKSAVALEFLLEHVRTKLHRAILLGDLHFVCRLTRTGDYPDLYIGATMAALAHGRLLCALVLVWTMVEDALWWM